MLDQQTDRRAGFTLLELIVAMVILSVAILGLGSTTASLVRSVAEEEIRFAAVQVVEDRISEIRMDPRYGGLEALYQEEESDLAGMDGFTRRTEVERFEAPTSGGRVFDYTVVVVTVDGPGLENPISRRFAVAAP